MTDVLYSQSEYTPKQATVSATYPAAKGGPVFYDIFFVSSRHVETVVLLSHKDADGFISVKMEYEDGVDRLPERVAYSMIKEYVESKYGFKVLCLFNNDEFCVKMFRIKSNGE